MKIAISSEGGGMEGKIAEHFRRAPEFVLVETEEKQVKSVKAIKNPYLKDPVPGVLPEFIKKTGANVVLTGGAGPMAVKALNEMGITLVLGCKGKISDAVRGYLEENLKTGSNICEH